MNALRVAVLAALLVAGGCVEGQPVETAQPAVTSTVERGTVADDEPGWNCLTMGNRECGPSFVPLGVSVSDELGQTHAGCLVMVGDTSTLVCPDGYVSES